MTEHYGLRPLKVLEDYEGSAALLNVFFSEPISAERLKEDDANLYEVGHTYMDDNGLLAGMTARVRRASVRERQGRE
ncbi:hypothetical protein [Cohnella rhizosphaerae]|uniref:Uncharacterized protein n=1 Tax=Cohnella rhizosphaerae TaxID=1457232 RepID=A0A9X4KUJ1_9BACL|nr:hypothetical protein [Cohnella rhizosphaerae]MDG0811324.1 hypothetical protein [Cohnella rhizosphaerae]